MMTRAQKSAALAVLYKAYRTYENRSFPVDLRGSNYEPLRNAERLGWVWWSGNRCAITDAGLRELEPYRQYEPKPLVQYICPVCLSVVAQPDRGDGLPATVSCGVCAEKSLEAAERLRKESVA